MNGSFCTKEVCTNFPWGLLYRRRRTGVQPLKLVIFNLMHFANIVKRVAICNYIALNGFVMTQRQMTLKVESHMWVYNRLENFIDHVCTAGSFLS